MWQQNNSRTLWEMILTLNTRIDLPNSPVRRSNYVNGLHIHVITGILIEVHLFNKGIILILFYHSNLLIVAFLHNWTKVISEIV